MANSRPPSKTGGAASPRRSFALTGRSEPLDPRTHAVRSDIADVRLAERVFAPHYAEPVGRVMLVETTLRAGRDAGSEAIATLAAGDAFELLDVTGGIAWGVEPSRGLVGYLDAAALGTAEAA